MNWELWRLTSEQQKQLEKFLETLLLWNKKMALVSQSDPRQIHTKHFADCLFAGQWVGNARRILDLGSGAGFPGIIFSILCRDASVTMVDSNRKKVSFLVDVIAQARLTNARAIE